MKPIWIIFFLLPIAQHSQAWKRFKRPICDPVKCDVNCKEVSSPRGCPTCLCEVVPEIKDEVLDVDKPLCSPPLCPPGCEIEIEFEGPCPGCKCEKKIEDELGLKVPIAEIVCDPPLCPPGCELEKVFEGPCPGCKCEGEGKDVDFKIEIEKPLCSPPLCPPGCIIETEFEGPCPGCKCEGVGKDKDVLDVKIPDIMCSPPLCLPGCEIEKEFEGPCPGCKCEGKEEEVKKDCPPVLDCVGPCKVEEDENGCEKCVCKPECNIPLCKQGCFIKNRPGRCPFCYCSKWSRKH